VVTAANLLSHMQGLAQAGGVLFGMVTGAVMAFVMSGVAGMVGLVWSAIVTFVTMPLVYLFVRSLRLRGNLIWFGAVWGGLIGFLAVFPLPMTMMGAAIHGPTFDDLLPVAIVLAIGPGLTTIVGQLGGAWGARRAIEARSAKNWAATLAAAGGWGDVVQPAPDGSGKDAESPADEAPGRFQFGIRHLLWITVWASLLLSLIRLSGIPFQFVLPLLIGWLVYQSATFYFGSRLLRRLGPWWSARRKRLSSSAS
jgi:hypothetical protein